jgi:hypothetical protein
VTDMIRAHEVFPDDVSGATVTEFALNIRELDAQPDGLTLELGFC